MATDQKIDPQTRDFVDAPDGSWVEDPTSTTAVLCQLDGEEGLWWGDPTAGSKNKAILRSDLPTAPQLVDSTTRALKAMAQAGLISDATVVENKADESNVLGLGDLFITWRDRATNRPADLAYAPLGGSPVVPSS